jgi:hypothetical protein
MPPAVRNWRGLTLCQSASRRPVRQRESASTRTRRIRPAATWPTPQNAVVRLFMAAIEGIGIGELMRITGTSRPTLYRHLTQHAKAGRAVQVARSRTEDRSARTRPAREKFPPALRARGRPRRQATLYERRRRVEHAKRAYMLRLSKRGMAARKSAG